MSSSLLSSFLGLSTSTIIAIVLTTSLIALLFLFPRDELDLREPPLAYSRIPLSPRSSNQSFSFFAKLNSFLTKISNTFQSYLPHRLAYQIINSIVSKTQPSPITTLLIGRQRIYIISSPNIVQLAFRASKTIDFETIKQHASCKAIGYGQHAYDIVKSPLIPDPEIQGRMANYMMDLHTEMYGALAQGPALLRTNRRILNGLVRSLNSVGDGVDVKLFDWLKLFYTTASAEALYGVENPVKWDPSFVQLVWDFENDLGLLVLDTFPYLIARKGYLARSIMGPQFEKYYSAGLLPEASAFIKGRAKCAYKWGLTENEISNAEITILFAAVTNTVPNVFYMLCWIYSSPTLVQELREEVQGIVSMKDCYGGGKEGLLDIEHMREKCPLLTACFHEALRLLLKKGAIVKIPTGVLQADKATWGEDAEEFNPHRWLPSPPSSNAENQTQDEVFKSKEMRKIQNAAYMPFGGGKNLCPGRHLAFNEIAAFVAVVVQGFDITGRDGDVVNVPMMATNKLGDGSTSPKGDVDVRVRRRQGFEDVRWQVVVGGVEEGVANSIFSCHICSWDERIRWWSKPTWNHVTEFSQIGSPTLVEETQKGRKCMVALYLMVAGRICWFLSSCVTSAELATLMFDIFARVLIQLFMFIDILSCILHSPHFQNPNPNKVPD
ncbi:uncharacterized protein RCO7_01934 [Rhynchosporium graminicola]|uniref:Cytochrome P450 7B1 n=1 Tax=Rhynchosporium graminicola TaxID=2792576 RepID=A0A1E1KUB6_9HELO|nr:uncharacterized protein RCO7_01934 [Rhynchosporium commune]